jgi:hypothetical protein
MNQRPMRRHLHPLHFVRIRAFSQWKLRPIAVARTFGRAHGATRCMLDARVRARGATTPEVPSARTPTGTGPEGPRGLRCSEVCGAVAPAGENSFCSPFATQPAGGGRRRRAPRSPGRVAMGLAPVELAKLQVTNSHQELRRTQLKTLALMMTALAGIMMGCDHLIECSGGDACRGSNGDCMSCSQGSCNSGGTCSSVVNGVACCVGGGGGGGGGSGCQSGYCNSNGVCCPRGMLGCGGHCYADSGAAYRGGSCTSFRTVCD